MCIATPRALPFLNRRLWEHKCFLSNQGFCRICFMWHLPQHCCFNPPDRTNDIESQQKPFICKCSFGLYAECFHNEEENNSTISLCNTVCFLWTNPCPNNLFHLLAWKGHKGSLCEQFTWWSHFLKTYVPAKKPASWVVWILTSLSFKSWT